MFNLNLLEENFSLDTQASVTAPEKLLHLRVSVLAVTLRMKSTQTSVSCIVSCSAVAVRNVLNYSVNISILCRASWLQITTWWTTSWIRPMSFLASTPGCCPPAERTLTCLTPVSTRFGSQHIWICCWPSARLNLSYLVYRISSEVQDKVGLTAFHISVNRIQFFEQLYRKTLFSSSTHAFHRS